MCSVLNEQCVFTLAEVVSNTELRSKCFVMNKDGRVFNFSGFYMDGTIGLMDVINRKGCHIAPSDFNNYLAIKKTSEVFTYDSVYLIKNKNDTADILFWNKTMPQYIRLPSNKKVISLIYLNDGVFEDNHLIRIRTQDRMYYIRVIQFNTSGNLVYRIRTACPGEKYISDLKLLRLLKKVTKAQVRTPLCQRRVLSEALGTKIIQKEIK